MQTTAPSKPSQFTWTYVSLKVIDGDRHLKPAQVGPAWILFDNAPGLVSGKVQIIIANGDDETSRFARVLPHDPQEVRIPIELLPE